jgi:hypothetical protein
MPIQLALEAASPCPRYVARVAEITTVSGDGLSRGVVIPDPGNSSGGDDKLEGPLEIFFRFPEEWCAIPN